MPDDNERVRMLCHQREYTTTYLKFHGIALVKSSWTDEAIARNKHGSTGGDHVQVDQIVHVAKDWLELFQEQSTRFVVQRLIKDGHIGFRADACLDRAIELGTGFLDKVI